MNFYISVALGHFHFCHRTSVMYRNEKWPDHFVVILVAYALCMESWKSWRNSL
jgi:hypothetical protein